MRNGTKETSASSIRLFGCLLLGLFRCVDIASAYRSINWQSLVLIVGMMPFSLALQRTGGVAMGSHAERVIDAQRGMIAEALG